jgi:hypothetical protein
MPLRLATRMVSSLSRHYAPRSSHLDVMRVVAGNGAARTWQWITR